MLGAGGAGALTFHAGVLDALEHVGEHPARSPLIIGTSAGAVTGAFLRLGLDHDRAVADWIRPPTEAERQQLRQRLVRGFRPWPLDAGVARRLRSGAPLLAALAPMLPAGTFPTRELLPWFADEPLPPGLWVPAVRADSATTVVFGRDRHDFSLVDTLTATMAVPGTFQPHRSDDVVFVDGGTVSSTHADTALTAGLDRVIVSAPMARPEHGWVLRHAARRLDAEVGRLTRRGVESVVVRPDPEHADLFLGFPRHHPERADEIRRHGFDRAMEALR